MTSCIKGVETQAQAADCLSYSLDFTFVCSIYLSIPGSVCGHPHTWKPFSCSCSIWRRRVCKLLMIRLWWPISSTPIRLTSLGREGKHKNTKHTHTHTHHFNFVLVKTSVWVTQTSACFHFSHFSHIFMKTLCLCIRTLSLSETLHFSYMYSAFNLPAQGSISTDQSLKHLRRS